MRIDTSDPTRDGPGGGPGAAPHATAPGGAGCGAAAGASLANVPDLDRAIAICLDAEALAAELRASWPAPPGTGVRAVRVGQARRSASRRRHPHPLTLRLDLELHGPGHDDAHTLPAYLRVYRDAQAAAADAAAQPGTVPLPRLRALLWPWPADPGLPQLGALLDPAQTGRWWSRPADAVQLLRHEPEQRATLRYTRAACDDTPAAALYAKTFSDARGEAIARRFEHFWRLAAGHARAPRVAEPLGYDAATRTLWQAAAPGRPLREVLGDHGASVAAPRPGSIWAGSVRPATAVAAALACIHAAPRELAGGPAHDAAYWLQEVARRRRKIARAQPALGAQVERIASALEATVEDTPEPVLIHGDWHPDQVWLDGDHVVLFDFDEFTLGDAMEDVAAFATRLGAGAAEAAFATAFVGACAQVAPRRFSQRRLRWHLAVQQLVQASRAFVFQQDGWPARLRQHLDRAEALARPHGTLPLPPSSPA